MCTLSWTATRSGYELLFNRDERRTRGPEEGPRKVQRSGVHFLAPRDTDAGGSWIAVNELGATVCLLNGYIERRGPASPRPRSRGQLVVELASAASPAQVEDRLRASNLAPFEPFVLCAFQQVRENVVAEGELSGRAIEWDGLDLVARSLEADDRPICSSGHDAALARARRGAEWERMRAAGPMTPERLIEFHRSHLDAAGPASPCMHRADAETRSLIRVQVSPSEVLMSHAPGAPCTTPLGPPLRLARLPHPALEH